MNTTDQGISNTYYAVGLATTLTVGFLGYYFLFKRSIQNPQKQTLPIDKYSEMQTSSSLLLNRDAKKGDVPETTTTIEYDKSEEEKMLEVYNNFMLQNPDGNFFRLLNATDRKEAAEKLIQDCKSIMQNDKQTEAERMEQICNITQNIIFGIYQTRDIENKVLYSVEEKPLMEYVDEVIRSECIEIMKYRIDACKYFNIKKLEFLNQLSKEPLFMTSSEEKSLDDFYNQFSPIVFVVESLESLKFYHFECLKIVIAVKIRSLPADVLENRAQEHSGTLKKLEQFIEEVALEESLKHQLKLDLYHQHKSYLTKLRLSVSLNEKNENDDKLEYLFTQSKERYEELNQSLTDLSQPIKEGEEELVQQDGI